MTKPIPLEPGQVYHIYNRGTNRENIFIEERNYTHFLGLYGQHVEPVADTYAYCLLRNHFHLLVRIKDASSPNVAQAFSNLFNAYAKAINKAYGRTGSLFQHPFGRIRVDNDRYFARLVVYIHRNPQKHGLIDDFRDWPHSSYHALISTQPTRLKREEALAWFGGLGAFRLTHDEAANEQELHPLVDEDFD